ncbi:hypothetical protein [Brachyspira aalborgi]|nr:hypothetical protein [Brachyspira aalborgi]
MNNDLLTCMKFFRAIKQYKEFVANEKLINAYKHRETLINQ